MPDSRTPKVKKLIKALGDTVASELDALDADALRATIVRCEANIDECEAARDADTDLAAAKERVKFLAGPHNDAIKFQRAKQRYAAMCLADKGQAE